jgi:hypothetical protein
VQRGGLDVAQSLDAALLQLGIQPHALLGGGG